MIDYKLVDVPELGYFGTDRPHPRGELLVKSDQICSPATTSGPRSPPRCSTPTATTTPATSSPRLGPDQVQYVDRRNNVLKLSQGEFVTVSKLEAAFGDSPLVRQIFVYGNSARLVPAGRGRADRGRPVALRRDRTEVGDRRLAEGGRAGRPDLQSYEIPRDFLVETTPFTLENGLLTGIRKLAWPQLKERYGAELEQLYVDLADGQADELRALRAERRRPARARDRQPGGERAARCGRRRRAAPTRSSPISVETRCRR